MTENNSQVSTDRVSKSYSLSNLLIDEEIIEAISHFGFSYIQITDTGIINSFYTHLPCPDAISLPPVNCDGYYILDFGCSYKIA